MARSRGRIDLSELKALQKRFENLDQKQRDKFQEELVKEKVKYFLGDVIRLTPVGQYDNGQVGGYLRRNWTTKNPREAAISTAFNATPNSINSFVDNDLNVNKQGKTYSIEVANNAEYALT